MPWFGGPGEEPVAEPAEVNAESDAQLQQRIPPASDSGIATGGAAHDKQYTLLASRGDALASPDVGYFIDVHEARLRQVLANTPVHMQRGDGQIRLVIPGSMSFGTNSAEIMEAVRPVLRDIAVVLVEFDKTLVSVLGHTDDRGDAAYNRTLSERRAVAVALFLARHGVAKDRLVGIGYGEEQPVAESDTETARTANRRIEILIEPVVMNGKTQT